MTFEPGSWLDAVAPTVEAMEAAVRPDVVASKLRFLTAAYTAVWIILAGYLFLISVRQRRLERQIRALRERLGTSRDPRS